MISPGHLNVNEATLSGAWPQKMWPQKMIGTCQLPNL